MKTDRTGFTAKILYLALILLSCFQLHTLSIHSGLDNSWQYALNLFFHKGILWGKNAIFTYGPLGMVFGTIPIGNNFPAALAFWLILEVFTCLLFAYILFSKPMRHINSRPQNIIASLIMFYVGTVVLKGFELTGEHVLIFLVLCLLSLCRYTDEIKFFTAAAFITILSMFLKFSAAAANFLSLSLFVLVSVMSGKSWRKYLAVLCCVPIVFCMCFLAYTPSVSELVCCIRGGYEISSGYNSAMSCELPRLAPLSFLLPVFLLIILIKVFALTKCRHSFSYAALFSAALFMAFKHGLAVRHFHILMPLVYIYLSVYILFMEHELPVTSGTLRTVKACLCVFFCITLGISALGQEKAASERIMYLPVRTLQALGLNSTALEKINRNGSRLISEMLTDPVSSFCRKINDAVNYDSSKLDERAVKTPSEFLSAAGNETLSVYPWELSLFHDFPDTCLSMPVIQAYSAYTAWLDKQNAGFFADGKTAPAHVIFNIGAIDGRFPLIEYPNTWLELLRNYGISQSCIVSSDGEEHTEFLLSRRTPKDFVIRETGTQKFARDDVISIPATDQHCLMKVNMPLSLTGQLAKIFWNVPAVMMDAEFSDGRRISKRILPDVMSNYTLISNLALDDASFAAIMNGDLNINRVKSIRFSGDGLKYYSSEVSITFSELRY
ncbi:MAG: hypothetical protein IJS28_10595 [Synergistaceae bacterium]|nr:hypothetical protein [Synergistaceae bacterium]